jgi:hypothetical protein
MLTRSRKSERNRRYRERLRSGRICLKVEILEAEFAEALILSGRLDEASALQRHAIELCAGEILQTFTDRWRQHR